MGKSNNIQKQRLIGLVNRQLEHPIGYFHVYSVVNILVEELVRELKTQGKLKILNFGTFLFKPLKPKTITNIVSGKPIITQSRNKLGFKLSSKVIRYLKGKAKR